MKKVILILMIAMTSLVGKSQVKIIPPYDKLLHMTVSAAISEGVFLASYNYTKNKKQSLLIASGTAIVIGLTKEILDVKTSGFSGGDLAYDVIGISYTITTNLAVIKINDKKRNKN